MKCPKCNAYVYSSDKFCRQCGRTLETEECKYGDNIPNSKYDSSSCHEKQYEYSYNYSNNTTSKNDMNKSHADQYDYSYKYSYDSSKYAYAQSYTPSGEDKYLKAYVGPNYEKIKKSKFSMLTLFFGGFYLLYKKLWGCAFLYIIIYAAALLLLNEDLSDLISIVLNIFFSVKFNELYLKQAENEVEKIKQRNPDKTTQELLDLCKKKGKPSLTAPIIIVLLFVIMPIIAIITYIIASETNPQNYHQENTTTEYDSEEKINTNTFNTLTYELPEGFNLTYSYDKYKGFNYYDTNTRQKCYITFTKYDSTMYQDTEDYLNIHYQASNSSDTLSEVTPIILNNNEWKYKQIKTSQRTETNYVIVVDNTLYEVKTLDYNNYYTSNICTSKYNELLQTLSFNNAD